MLGNLINWLFCKHKYQIIYKARQVWYNGEFAGVRYHMQCEKCGKLKRKDL